MSEQQTLRDSLTAQSRRFEKKTFLELEGARYSYAEVDERTDRAATCLNKLGMRFGDRVALLLSNRPELVFFLLGAPKVGITPVLINPNDAEAAALLSTCNATAVVTEARFSHLRNSVAGVRHWITVDAKEFDEAPFHRLAHGPVLGFWPDLSPDDPALICYTSGRTGSRKAVELNHRNLLSNCQQIGPPYRIDSTDRFYCMVPLSSAYAEVFLLLAPMLAGATCILRQAYCPDSLRDIQECQATILAGIPELYLKIVRAEDFDQRNLSCLRLAVCSQGALPEDVLRSFKELHDAIIVEAYGLTEAACLTCTNPYTGLRKSGSLGLPLPGQECRIVDAHGVEQAPGEPGEIIVRGPNVMARYHDAPTETARVLRHGWLHTGDRGYADPEGYYYLVPRA